MKITPKQLTEKFAIHGYDPQHAWGTTAQPEQGCTAEDYIALAEQSLPDSRKQMTDFADEYGYSYAVLTQKDLYEYETGTKATSPDSSKSSSTNSPVVEANFRKWFEEKCKETGQNPNVDLLIVTSCVKDLDTAAKKTFLKGKSADRIIDYQRGMYVVLKQSDAKKETKSLNTLARLINDIENDKRTIARKNLYWKPHETTGFRAHKTLRTATVPPGQEYEGMQCLTEVKIEHESQMGLDRATRPFLHISRAAARAKRETNYNLIRDFSSTTFDKRRPQNPSKHTRKTAQSSNVIAGWSRDLYNRINSDAGLDLFTNPQATPAEKAAIKPPSHQEILNKIKHCNSTNVQKGLVKTVLNSLAQSEVMPEKQTNEIKQLLGVKRQQAPKAP